MDFTNKKNCYAFKPDISPMTGDGRKHATCMSKTSYNVSLGSCRRASDRGFNPPLTRYLGVHPNAHECLE